MGEIPKRFRVKSEEPAALRTFAAVEDRMQKSCTRIPSIRAHFDSPILGGCAMRYCLACIASLALILSTAFGSQSSQPLSHESPRVNALQNKEIPEIAVYTLFLRSLMNLEDLADARAAIGQPSVQMRQYYRTVTNLNEQTYSFLLLQARQWKARTKAIKEECSQLTDPITHKPIDSESARRLFELSNQSAASIDELIQIGR